VFFKEQYLIINAFVVLYVIVQCFHISRDAE